MDVETKCENLLQSLETLEETQDYLSYATLLDDYLTASHSIEEQRVLLECVTNILSSNPTLTYEIGWDIPSLVLPMKNCGLVDGIFDILITVGNPKELLLRACEMMPTCSVDRFFPLAQLMEETALKIQTDFPSKFLAMIYAAHMNFFMGVKIPKSLVGQTLDSVLKVVCEFAQLANDQDRSVVVHLGQAFVTHSVALVMKDHSLEMASSFYKDHGLQKYHLLENQTTQGETESLISSLKKGVKVLERDLDTSLHSCFEELQRKANQLLQDASSQDVIFSTLVNDYNKTGLSNFTQTVQMSPVGIVILSGLSESLPFSSAINLLLKMEFPGMMDSSLSNIGLQDVLIYLVQASVQFRSTAVRELSTEILNLTLQTLISISSNSKDPLLRIPLYELVKTLLMYAEQQESWNFIMDTLVTCPFPSAKGGILAILKFLLTNSVVNVGPKVPSRETAEPKKAISYSDQRAIEFENVALQLITETTAEPNEQNCGTLLTLINLIISLKGTQFERIRNKLLEEIEKGIANHPNVDLLRLQLSCK